MLFSIVHFSALLFYDNTFKQVVAFGSQNMKANILLIFGIVKFGS